MTRHVAFLRGINLGNRRLTMDELRGHLEALDAANVRTFLASGNVILDTEPGRDARTVEEEVEGVLGSALGYAVDTYVRSMEALREIVARDDLRDAREGGFKPQLIFLRDVLPEGGREALEALETPDDVFRVLEREVAWLRRGRLSDASISQRELEDAVGPANTMRTLNTVERIVAKFGGSGG